MSRILVDESLDATFFLISEIITMEDQPNQEEWLALAVLAAKVFDNGNEKQKKVFARMMHDGARRLESVDKPYEAALVDHINTNFRVWCKPLLNNLSSFTHDEGASSQESIVIFNN